VSFQSSLVGLDHRKAQITNEKDAMAAKERILKARFTVREVKEGEKMRRPQPPFTTSSLQQEASRKLNFSTSLLSYSLQSHQAKHI
jgi:DNA topoisomerase-1